MILTPDYKSVFASFDTPVDFEVVKEDISGDYGEGTYDFQVGPLKYRVEIYRSYHGYWGVSFEVEDVVGSPEELQEYFSRILKRRVKFFEVEEIRDKILGNRYGNIKVADSRGVLSGVVSVLKYFVNKYKPECLSFSVYQEDKGRVYKAMIRHLLPGWVATPNDRGFGFDVCKPDVGVES